MATALYGSHHPYGLNELGTEASVKATTRDDLQAFWKQTFVPNNAALVVAGNISMNELKPLAEKVLGSWSRGGASRPALGAPEPVAARIIIVDKPGAPQTQLRVFAIGAPRSTPDFRAIQVMNNGLGGLFSSRIYHNLREEHGYTYGAFSRLRALAHGGWFVSGSGVRTEVTAPAVGEMVKEIKRMPEAPITPQEMTLAKSSIVRALPSSFETTTDTIGMLADIPIYNLPLDYYAQFSKKVDAVTDANVHEVAKKYLLPDKMLVVVVGDRKVTEGDLKKLGLGEIELRDTDGNLKK
jgi:zinc protease